MSDFSSIAEALERTNPSSDAQRKAEFSAMMRYRHALGSWYAGMFAAGRRGEAFTRSRPEPENFQPQRY
jgi:hypothetical protein